MKKIFKQDVNGVTYSMECVCPSCGEYSYNLKKISPHFSERVTM